jgi:hypothetical protein
MNTLEEMERRMARLEQRHCLLRDAVMRGFWETADKLDRATLAGRHMRCPICNRTELRDGLTMHVDHCRFGGGKLERYLCPGCGCIYGPAKFLDLSQEMVDADYALLYDGYAEADSTGNEIRAFRSLDPRPGGLYLNWGCGRWSQTVPMLRDENYDVWATSPPCRPEPPNSSYRGGMKSRRVLMVCSRTMS